MKLYRVIARSITLLPLGYFSRLIIITSANVSYTALKTRGPSLVVITVLIDRISIKLVIPLNKYRLIILT